MSGDFKKHGGTMSKNKRAFKRRRDFLAKKQEQWIEEKGFPSEFFRDELNALDWAIKTIEDIQANARIERGLPHEPFND